MHCSSAWSSPLELGPGTLRWSSALELSPGAQPWSSALELRPGAQGPTMSQKTSSTLPQRHNMACYVVGTLRQRALPQRQRQRGRNVRCGAAKCKSAVKTGKEVAGSLLGN